MIEYINGGTALIDEIKIELLGGINVWIDVFDTSLSKKWLQALEYLLHRNYKLEKHYCFFGFADHQRNAEYLCNQINLSISHINAANLGYHIDDIFTVENTLDVGPVGTDLPGRKIIQSKFNKLHRYFEDLQGTSGRMSQYYTRANSKTKWHIRQLNLLCHEFESWALSYRKQAHAPEWQRPSQLMCWLNAPRFQLDDKDFECFGLQKLHKPMGGVFVGVNKAVGKHHWEVFNDEGRDSRVGELTTTVMSGQTEAAGDFDIEWAQDTRGHPWMTKQIAEFQDWLIKNGFDPGDKSLTIGHPQIGQVDLKRSFGTMDYKDIWQKLNESLDVVAVETSNHRAEYLYHWTDTNYIDFMIGE